MGFFVVCDKYVVDKKKIAKKFLCFVLGKGMRSSAAWSSQSKVSGDRCIFVSCFGFSSGRFCFYLFFVIFVRWLCAVGCNWQQEFIVPVTVTNVVDTEHIKRYYFWHSFLLLSCCCVAFSSSLFIEGLHGGRAPTHKLLCSVLSHSQCCSKCLSVSLFSAFFSIVAFFFICQTDCADGSFEENFKFGTILFEPRFDFGFFITTEIELKFSSYCAISVPACPSIQTSTSLPVCCFLLLLQHVFSPA